MNEELAGNITAAVGVALAFAPVVGLVLARQRVGRLNAAAWLVMWGAFIAAAEHANFAIGNARALAGTPGVGAHERYHFFMAGVFTIVSAILICFIAITQLQKGQRAGWYAVLAALVVGGGFELSGAGGILFHGFPPSWALGLAIYAYPAAWGAALVISYTQVFGPASAPEAAGG